MKIYHSQNSCPQASFYLMRIFILLFAWMIFSLYGVYAQQTYTVKVVINNIKNDSGKLRLALFDSTASFPEEDGASYGQEIPAKSGSVTTSFNNVVPGVYAIAAYHDENKNGVMDTRVFGIPTESYGFSNNPATVFGPPAFEDASFTVNEDTSISIDFK